MTCRAGGVNDVVGRVMAWRFMFRRHFAAHLRMWIARAHHAGGCGPLLVSGSRSCVAMVRDGTVQQLLRTQYPVPGDFSADVSLFRAETVRSTCLAMRRACTVKNQFRFRLRERVVSLAWVLARSFRALKALRGKQLSKKSRLRPAAATASAETLRGWRTATRLMCAPIGAQDD